MKSLGRKLFVQALKEEGVDTCFGYPGGTVTELFDELYQQQEIDVVLPRHEQGAVHAAEGYARATGKVGVCLVTSGPGATNAVTGLADAHYDSIPLVCFTGQVALDLVGNDAFQEVDIVGMTRNITKYSVTVRKREDLGRIIKEAFFIARSGKPGPVLVDIPKNIQMEEGPGEYPHEVNIRGYKPNGKVHIGQLKRAFKLLQTAKKPIILAGGGVNIADARDEFRAFVEGMQIPVVTTIMGKGCIPTNHPYYIGNAGLHGKYAANQALNACDVLFSIGTRFNDRITGVLETFAPNAQIIHVDIATSSISRNVVVDIPVVADAKLALEKLNEWVKPLDTQEWVSCIREWDEQVPLKMDESKEMTPEKIIRTMSKYAEGGIVVTDVGQHQMWTTQFLEMNHKEKLITSGGLGTMGFGLPAAIGAQMGCPEKPVFLVVGDGSFQMTIQELATAVIEELPIVICLFNNQYLGMVRQMQQLFYKEHYEATCLRRRKSCPWHCPGPNKNCPPYSPDFIALAESYGMKAMRVENKEQMEGAFAQALSNKKGPTLIEFFIESSEIVLPMVEGGKSISDMILPEQEEEA